MFSTILVPLDGSDASETALSPAVEIAKRFGSSIILVQVTPGYGTVIGATAAETFGSSGSVAAAQETAIAAEEAASAYLDAVRQEYGAPEWHTMIAEGDSSDAIVESAHQTNADLIVMATHARSGLKRLFLGSIVEDVIRHSGVPVLVVYRESAEE